MKHLRFLGLVAVVCGLALMAVRLNLIDAEWLGLLLPGILIIAGVYFVSLRSHTSRSGGR